MGFGIIGFPDLGCVGFALFFDSWSWDFRFCTWQENFAEQYFDTTGNFILNGFYGEVAESQTAILKARDTMFYAINNLLYVKDIGNEGYNLNDPITYGGSAPAHTYDPNYSSGNAQSLSNCADIQQNITFDTSFAPVQKKPVVATTTLSAILRDFLITSICPKVIGSNVPG